jgi:hypothetical protein
MKIHHLCMVITIALISTCVSHQALAQAVGSELAFDGSGAIALPEAIAAPPDRYAATADMPCGDRTVAVLKRPSGETAYAFCVFDDGDVIALEYVPTTAVFHSPLRSHTGPVSELLKSLAPDTPAEVLDALKYGRLPKLPIKTASIYKSTVDELAISTNSTASTADFCGNGQAWRDEFIGNASWFIRSKLSCSNHPAWEGFNCAGKNHVFHTVVGQGPDGWSQRTATAYANTSNGACAAYGQVVSCGGPTLFRAYRREQPGSGAFNPSLHFWIDDGGMATWYMTASSNLCKPGSDKDDFRFRADSYVAGGARHRHGYMFIHEHSASLGCVPCPP